MTVVEGRRLSLSHLDKVYFPQTGTLKGEIVRYYAQVQATLLPHLHDRPLSFLRCPEGVDGDRFFAKSPPSGTPGWVRTVAVPSTAGGLRQVVVDDAATLVWAANLGCVELHVPQWHAAEPAMADRIVLDLDPGDGADILTCRAVARLLRERLAADGLTTWVKTSGSKGLHLLVPIGPTPSEDVSAYAKAVAAELERAHPELVVHTMAKARRVGRVLVDWSQNAAKKTTAAPYTVRARPRPTVSTPLDWDELDRAATPEALVFTIADIPGRLAEHGDLLAPLLLPSNAHVLPTAPVAPATAPAPAPATATAPRAAPTAPAPHATPAAPTGLEPPVEVMRPAAVPELPPEDGLGGAGVLYELKLDGFRCVAFARGQRPPYLQSRSGRDLCADFPPIADAVARLPEGLVLDTELVAWRDGRFAFGELLRTPAARAADGVVLGLIAFDVLALPGGRDVRRLPLAERRRLLTELLADVPPPVQAVLATGSRDEALNWAERLAGTGVEGIVCKSLASAYRAKGAGQAWVKYRPSDTVDATVTAFTGTPARPRALLLRLDDGTVVLGSPQLTPVQARQVAEAASGLLGEPRTDPEHGTVHPLRSPLRAEVRIGTGRAAGARFVRLRGD